ncbi:UNVERIFIED_CONTAM: hypothetical protein Sradi_0223900 [Sesamum radiatum]|uniref:Transposase n=1 Tax=Sesamum radiatum TaxID=300843 RepID=A0AAW2VZX9_SESRA
MDRVFIASLAKSVEGLGFPPVELSVTSITEAVAKVNQCFGTRLCYRYGLCRWNHLKERHATFSWLINLNGVTWIPKRKILLVDEHLWDDISREKPFARAYRSNVEPAWNELKIIFGDPLNEPANSSDEEIYEDEANSTDETIVLISSDSEDSCIM